MILFYPPTYESVVVACPQTGFEHVQRKLLGLWAHVVPCGVEGLQHSHRQVGSIVGWGVDEQGQHDQQRQDHYDHSSIDDDNDDDDDEDGDDNGDDDDDSDDYDDDMMIMMTIVT